MARVAVCIPTRNYGRWLGQTIGSVQAQTLRDLEILVCDNASTDDTAAVVGALAAGDARLRYLRHERDLGMVGNWNACLERVSAPYVKVLCADDLLEPTCLERQAALLDAHPAAALASCARRLVDEQGAPTGPVLAFSDRAGFTGGDEVIGRCLVDGNVVGEPSAVLLRRGALDRGFDPAYRHLTDLALWLHLLERAGLAFTPEPLCRFRVHGDQATRHNVASGVAQAEELRLLARYLRWPGVAAGDRLRGLRRGWYLWRSMRAARSGGAAGQAG